MTVDSSTIIQNNQQMFDVIKNAQQATNELSNNVAKLSIAEKTSTPKNPVVLNEAIGQNVNTIA
jgi:hypothetical protein